RAERDRVAALSQAKSAFLSRLSHELRTPLNAVLGFAQLLALRLGGAEQAPHRHEVAQIEQAGWLLLRKIDDLLDLSQVEAATPAAPLAGVPVAVAACWQQVCDALAPLAAARGVQLQAEVAPADAQVLADPARLPQVLQQLADNAVRHPRPQGTVALRLQREGPQWCLAVQDDGPGIPPEQLACLFEAFERGPQTGAAHDGLGIGLTLARWWVQRMGGSIAAQSTPGQGSTLCVRLPAADGGDPA
ncbi:MAG: histidine kinase, partial [Burkholderiales bacterium PBB5]